MAAKRRRIALLLGIGLLAVGVLHVPLARSLGAGCPIEAPQRLSLEEREALRLAVGNSLHGEGVALALPALEFELNESLGDEVVAWARARSGTCNWKDQASLECEGVRVSKHARAALYADFDLAGKLVAVSLMSRTADRQEALTLLDQAREGLTESGREASLSTSALATPLAQARSELHFANYFASLSATHLGERGFLVSQVYRAF